MSAASAYEACQLLIAEKKPRYTIAAQPNKKEFEDVISSAIGGMHFEQVSCF